MNTNTPAPPFRFVADPPRGRWYNRLLLLVAGLGGLLYGVDVGIIAGALPYLEASRNLTAGQLSFIVAAVLLGSVISTLFAGMLADWLGRRWLMVLSGLLFVLSIPIIALASEYTALVLGRLLQGISAGLIGVVVPLYLAECLGANNRGKGTGIFQWLLTFGIFAAALIGMYLSCRVDGVARLGDVQRLAEFKDFAWRSIFWMSLPPGVLFILGALMVEESPRWLVRHGRYEAARRALLRSRSEIDAETGFREIMGSIAADAKGSTTDPAKESLLRRKYVIPFLLACIILACNQATGINSIIGYNATILIQSGLSDLAAHWGYVLFTAINFVATIAAVLLVDRKGRKFLLSVGSAGIIVSLIVAGLLFRSTEAKQVDCRAAVQATVGSKQELTLSFDHETARTWLVAAGQPDYAIAANPLTMVAIYSYGDFRAVTRVVRSDDPTAIVSISRSGCLPANKIVAFFTNPLANLEAARDAPLRIENVLLTPVPDSRNGWMVAFSLFAFVAFFAIGPGVCVWLALSELMPTRIRSNGMSLALLFNQATSTGIAAAFLPTVGKFGYSTLFFGFAGCTVIYFITATFFLPETKGKSLEEIEAHFEHIR